MTLRLWIDTDVGDDPDDAVALLCAATHPGVRLVGVSTTDGDTMRLRARVGEARRVLASVGHDDVLMYAGPPDPRALATAEALLAIGPLGNLARLVEMGHDLPPVAVMGGALRPVRHRGKVCDVEHNFGRDPVAAGIVVRRVPDLLLVPLDVTARMKLDGGALAALLDAAPVLGPEVDGWRARQAEDGLGPRDAPVCLHDPLALLALLGEEVVRVEKRNVAVAVDGAVLVDTPAGRDHDVVVDVDEARALRRLLDLLAGG